MSPSSAIYKDPSQSTEQRVKDLLQRMTLPEKVGQLLQLNGQDDLDHLIQEKHVGSLLHIVGERSDLAIQKAANTRLGIPLLIADDCIHGHSFFSGATIFPSQLGMACSWNRSLLEKVGRITAKEVSCTGIKWTFSPVLCLARDLRWGRINETFGEDPYLIGEFATSMIKGYQGEGLNDPTAILATAKHYAGYSETQGGRDASEADMSPRKLKSYFLPPFEKAAKNGCMSFMTGYQSIEGVPTTANRWLLREVLKEDWGFKGVLVTDWDNVGAMVKTQKICSTYAEAAALAVRSGNDFIMATPEFFEGALEAIEQKLLSENEIDEVCHRILSLKFEMGLFEHAGNPDIKKQKEIIGCKEHTDYNLQVSRESLVLLRNSENLLPLSDKDSKTIAVIGPNADDHHAQLGDWAGASGQVKWILDGHPRECHSTVLDGLKNRIPKNWKLTHTEGCSVKEDDESNIAEAVKMATEADVAVVVIGDNRDLIGECRSTATLEFQGGQQALLEALRKTNTPIVLVLVNSKPMVLPKAYQSHPQIIQAFNPGMAGGQAIAEMILGDFNPSGKLTISFPYHVGQQPIFYSQVRGQHGGEYADMTQDPIFAFGEGCSYTQYHYHDLKIAKSSLKSDDVLDVTVQVTNQGQVDGTEIVQLYISDLVTSATWVQKELKAFERVQLKAGETKTVTLQLAMADCSIVNVAGDRVVEAGEFEVQVGPNSRDEHLLKETFNIMV